MSSIFSRKFIRELWGRCSVYQELVARLIRKRNSRYSQWIKQYEFTLDENTLNSTTDQKLISILMPVYNPDIAQFKSAVNSVIRQSYSNWELCIVDDCSTISGVKSVISDVVASDSRIKASFRSENGNISQATNAALGLATGEWIGLLDQDDLLHPHALQAIARAVNRYPEAQIIYTDEDKIDDDGNRYQPFFKPDFSLELLRGQNYLNHFTVHRASNIVRVGGWRTEFDGSQDYDLNLRVVETIDPRTIVHIPVVLYHWRASNGSVARSIQNKSYAVIAGRNALQAHLDRTGTNAVAEILEGQPYYRVRYRLPPVPPLVSILIPTRDHKRTLENCIESILKRTAYKNYEIIVIDNGSSEAETVTYLNYISGCGIAQVLSSPGEFNYSKLNNEAVEFSNGDILCLLNNDVEISSEDWLSELVSVALQDGVGCVGPKLLYPNGRIQHAGIVTGIGGVAGHPFKYSDGKQSGYFSNLRLARNVSAVTGACLVVRREIFELAGGLDERNLAVAFNDVDFCLKVISVGYRNVFTPFVHLTHYESLTRGKDDSPAKARRFNKEVAYMRERWRQKLCYDSFYSRNLTLKYEDYSLAYPPRPQPNDVGNC